MGSMDSAISAMHTALQAVAGLAVTYHRGDASVSVTATIGQTTFRFDDEVGVTRIVTRDYLIATSALVLDGAAALPAAQDTITETRGSTVYTHTVGTPDGEPPYRFSDSGKSILRVHTIQTDVTVST